jgi:hypothetical protein
MVVATLLGFCPQLYMWSPALSPCTTEFENVSHSMYPMELNPVVLEASSGFVCPSLDVVFIQTPKSPSW